MKFKVLLAVMTIVIMLQSAISYNQFIRIRNMQEIVLLMTLDMIRLEQAIHELFRQHNI